MSRSVRTATPQADLARAADGQGGPTAAQLCTASVLVVDPCRDANSELEQVAQRLASEVDRAHDLERAHRLMRSRRYTVVVIDAEAIPRTVSSGTLPPAFPSVFIVVRRDSSQAVPSPQRCGCLSSDVLGFYTRDAPIQQFEALLQRAVSTADTRATVKPADVALKLSGDVLIVEDDLARSSSLRALVQQLVPSANVHTCLSLKDVAALPRLAICAMAIVNPELPDARGIDVVSYLAAQAPELPIVVSVETSSDVEEQVLLVGAQEMIARDPSIKTLARALRRAHVRKQAESKTRYLATHDGLTGLTNASFFRERLGQCLGRIHRQRAAGAVLYMDLDGFKQVNDRYGHSAGDEVLRVVGSRLLEVIRDNDAAARLGGDEFALLLEDVYEGTSARRVAQRVLRALSAPIPIVGQPDARITASIGIALCLQSGATAEGVIHAADNAMLEAKRAGKSQFCFAHETMDAPVPVPPRAQLTAELRNAVEAGDFYLMYQPQVDLRSRQVIGVEALLRWSRRGKSDVGPDAFVPMLEDMGLIEKVGAFVLSEACRHAQAWCSRRRAPLRVAVNVSPLQLEDPGFVSLALSNLQRYNLKPQQLELEITESTLMHRSTRTEKVLTQLRSNGIRIALDDFGTGYASLSYLRDLPFDALKIDRSFVAPLAHDERARTLVSAVIRLAHQLQLEVLAEGVENAAQLAYLRSQGCHSCQGFLFGKPHFVGHIRELLH